VEKSPEAFRTISEVAEGLDVPQHVLRFWESRFREIKPMKRGGGRRYYRPDDVDLLRGIRHLLYGEGYTIRGVQRLLREQGVRFVQSVWQPGAPQPGFKPADDEPDEATDRPESEVAASPPVASLSETDTQRLKAALRDLGECRRLLAAAVERERP
jgi:DNA-binding transcriptional MerR regulator